MRNRPMPPRKENDPYGTRTRVAGVKGRCPRPLDEGAERWAIARSDCLPSVIGVTGRSAERKTDPRPYRVKARGVERQVGTATFTTLFRTLMPLQWKIGAAGRRWGKFPNYSSPIGKVHRTQSRSKIESAQVSKAQERPPTPCTIVIR